MHTQPLCPAVGGSLGAMLQVTITDLSSHLPPPSPMQGEARPGGTGRGETRAGGSSSLSLQHPGGAAPSSPLCLAAKTSSK